MSGGKCPRPSQSRGKRKSQKACRKHGNFPNSGGNFPKIGGMTDKTKIEGENFKFVGDNYKKGQKFWRMKIDFFVWQRPNRENFGRSQRNFWEIGGILKQGGNALLPRGDGRPCLVWLHCSDIKTRALRLEEFSFVVFGVLCVHLWMIYYSFKMFRRKTNINAVTFWEGTNRPRPMGSLVFSMITWTTYCLFAMSKVTSLWHSVIIQWYLRNSLLR